MKKLAIGAVAVLVIIIGIGYFLLAPPPVTAALLYVESGDVQVNTGKGWISATDEMELDTGDSVKTGAGEATLILQEGEVVHLQPNTEIKLDKISGKSIKLTQSAGETWNKITKISGILEFSIETPNTVATVRGTEFMLNDAQLDVADGEVEFEKKSDKKKMMVRAKKKALAATMREEDMTETDFAKMNKFAGMEVNVLKKVRAREIRKHDALIKMAEKKGLTKAQMEQDLADVDAGKKNEDEFYEQVPAAMKPKAKRIYLLTKEIKRAQARAQQ
jgi:hypothetical protein